VLKPIKGIVDKVLDKLPFGNLIKGFADKFLKNPLALLTGGVLGGAAALLAGAQNPAQLNNFAQCCASTPAFADPVARQNLMNLIAYQHAMCIC